MRKVVAFNYLGDKGFVEQTLLNGQEYIFVSWATMGASLESIAPVDAFAEVLDKCLEELGSEKRAKRMSPELQALLAEWEDED